MIADTDLHKEIDKRLLTIQEMADKYHEQWVNELEYPYFYKITNTNQILYFLGPHHTFDPSNEQIPRIYDYWNSFLEVCKDKKCVVLMEGGDREISKNEDEAIRIGGEAQLMTLLAHRNNIECYSPEPDEKYELLELEKIFTKEEIIYNRFAGRAEQWGKFVHSIPLFEEYINSYLVSILKITEWDTPISPEAMTKYHDNIHDHRLNIEECIKNECFKFDSNPFQNKVSEVSGKIRDRYIATKILKEWEAGKSIFIVYGSAHAIALEKVLKELLS